MIRNNEFLNVSHAFLVQSFAANSGCENSRARPLDNVLIEGNLARYTETFRPSAQFMLINEGGDSPGEYAENITIRNNTAISTDALQCLQYEAGYAGTSSPPGTIEFSGNRCVGDPDYAAILLDNRLPQQHQNFVIRANSIEGINSGGKLNVRTYGRCDV